MVPLPDLINDFKDPAAFGCLFKQPPSSQVQVKQTHLSVVFLIEEFVVKVKKPVNFGFLDFSTPEKRYKACQDEVELNRRLAKSVYLRVVSIQKQGKYRVSLDEAGEEYAVLMKRLPDSDSLIMKLNSIDPKTLFKIASRLKQFHNEADKSSEISQYGTKDYILKNVRENFEQTREHPNNLISSSVYSFVESESLRKLQEFGPLMETRLPMVCDTHGDLRCEHVYLINNEILIIDCIEFNERFRYSDPICDVAFLFMDLSFQRRFDLAMVFLKEYLGSDDLLPLAMFYAAYRAVVRAKISGFTAIDPLIPVEKRNEQAKQAHQYWMLAYSFLTLPQQRPGLIVVKGLPGSGKSFISSQIVNNGVWLRMDQIRKDLAANGKLGPNIYSSEASEQTYGECLRLAKQYLQQERRVIVDATFNDIKKLSPFLDYAKEFGVFAGILHLECDRLIVKKRLQMRVNDISDADWSIYEKLESIYARNDDLYPGMVQVVNTDGDKPETMTNVHSALCKLGFE